jgi:arylsulfatase A-like enzyme
VLILSLLLGVAILQEKAAPPRRPSVLLITLDTTRADALGVYGGPEWATPNLDALARGGVRFTSARAPAPITLPAHASILTGLFPFQHGVRDNGTFKLSEGAFTLAERLKQAGYATAAVPAAFVVDSSFGLAQGFDAYFDLPPGESDATGSEGAERPASEVVALATKWLATLPAERPFFLWVHFFDAHFPYRPPADLAASHPFTPDPNKQKGGQRRDQNAHDYQLEVASIDRELPALFKAIERFGGAEQVLVAVLGDHGEGLGEHGEATHSALVHDATLRVPFLMKGAGLPAGAVVAAPVTTVDFAPTLLARLGLPAEAMAGADLTPLIGGKPLSTSRPLYAETCATWFTFGWGPLYTLIVAGDGTVASGGVVDGDGGEAHWKVVFGRTARLYDLDADPGEKHDVADAHAELVEAARGQLQDLAQKTVEATRRDLDDESKKKLNALAYLVDEQSSRRGGRVLPGWQPKEALTPEEGLKNQRSYSQANELWRAGKRDEALTQLIALTKLEPENSHYASAAAALLLRAGRPAEALPFAKKSVELAESGATRTTLVACLVALGQRDDALVEAQTTVKLFPKLPAAQLTVGELLCGRGRAAEAVAPLEAYLATPGGDPATRAHAQELLAQARAARDAKPAGGGGK